MGRPKIYTDEEIKERRKAGNARWYAANKDKIAATRRARYKRKVATEEGREAHNKACLRRYHEVDKYDEDNMEQRRIRAQEYYDTHTEQVAEAARQRYERMKAEQAE